MSSDFETLADWVGEIESAATLLAVAEANCDWANCMAAQKRLMVALQEIAPLLAPKGSSHE